MLTSQTMATTVRSALKLEDLYLMQAPTINQEIQLQEHSVPVWPTQLRRYTQITMPWVYIITRMNSSGTDSGFIW